VEFGVQSELEKDKCHELPKVSAELCKTEARFSDVVHMSFND
jgi:hypothetical protein